MCQRISQCYFQQHHNHQYIHIYINSTNIGTEGSKVLDGNFSITSITTTNLGMYQNNVYGTKLLANDLGSNTTVATIDLRENGISAGDTKLLSSVLASNIIINLYYKIIDANCIKFLANALDSNTTTATINVSDNGTSTKTIKALADALSRSTTVTTTNICSDVIDVKCSNF